MKMFEHQATIPIFKTSGIGINHASRDYKIIDAIVPIFPTALDVGQKFSENFFVFRKNDQNNISVDLVDARSQKVLDTLINAFSREVERNTAVPSMPSNSVSEYVTSIRDMGFVGAAVAGEYSGQYGLHLFLFWQEDDGISHKRLYLGNQFGLSTTINETLPLPPMAVRNSFPGEVIISFSGTNQSTGIQYSHRLRIRLRDDGDIWTQSLSSAAFNATTSLHKIFHPPPDPMNTFSNYIFSALAWNASLQKYQIGAASLGGTSMSTRYYEDLDTNWDGTLIPITTWRFGVLRTGKRLTGEDVNGFEINFYADNISSLMGSVSHDPFGKPLETYYGLLGLTKPYLYTVMQFGDEFFLSEIQFEGGMSWNSVPTDVGGFEYEKILFDPNNPSNESTTSEHQLRNLHHDFFCHAFLGFDGQQEEIYLKIYKKKHVYPLKNTGSIGLRNDIYFSDQLLIGPKDFEDLDVPEEDYFSWTDRTTLSIEHVSGNFWLAAWPVAWWNDPNEYKALVVVLVEKKNDKIELIKSWASGNVLWEDATDPNNIVWDSWRDVGVHLIKKNDTEFIVTYTSYNEEWQENVTLRPIKITLGANIDLSVGAPFRTENDMTWENYVHYAEILASDWGRDGQLGYCILTDDFQIGMALTLKIVDINFTQLSIQEIQSVTILFDNPWFLAGLRFISQDSWVYAFGGSFSSSFTSFNSITGQIISTTSIADRESEGLPISGYPYLGERYMYIEWDKVDNTQFKIVDNKLLYFLPMLYGDSHYFLLYRASITPEYTLENDELFLLGGMTSQITNSTHWIATFSETDDSYLMFIDSNAFSHAISLDGQDDHIKFGIIEISKHDFFTTGKIPLGATFLVGHQEIYNNQNWGRTMPPKKKDANHIILPFISYDEDDNWEEKIALVLWDLEDENYNAFRGIDAYDGKLWAINRSLTTVISSIDKETGERDRSIGLPDLNSPINPWDLTVDNGIAWFGNVGDFDQLGAVSIASEELLKIISSPGNNPRGVTWTEEPYDNET